MDFYSVGRFEIAKTLLEYGANVNFRNNKEEVPLHFAVQNGRFRIIFLKYLDKLKLYCYILLNFRKRRADPITAASI